MANTYTNLLTHIVFGTKKREPWLTPSIQDELFPYLGGIAKNCDFKIICSGGIHDHIHLLLEQNKTLPLSKTIQLLKTNSSHWFHQKFKKSAFSWQTGYGAFSVSQSAIQATCHYIQNQEEHHRKMSFGEEYLLFLKKNGIEFEEKYVFD